MASTKIALQEEIKKLNHEHNFDFPVTDDYKQLQKTAAEARKAVAEKEAAGADNQNSDDNANKTETPKASGDAVYVFLKNPAYVDKDGTQRVAGGLYHVNLAEYPRLAKITSDSGEIFEGKIPMRKLVKIAEWLGVDPEKHDDDELLDVLVTKPTLY